MHKIFAVIRKFAAKVLRFVRRLWLGRPGNDIEGIVFGALKQINGELKKGWA